MTDNETAPVDPEKAARVELLTKALVFALMTANEQSYALAVPAARKVADLMDDCGVRQTDQKLTEIELPGWITERVREDTEPTPVEPDHFAVQETDRVMEAPAPPSRIAKKFMAEPSVDDSFGGVIA